MHIAEVIYFGFELELLEAHIAEHRPHVDRLLVAEAPLTSTGYPKPMYARDNRSRFEKYDVELVELPVDQYRRLIPETNRPGFPLDGRLTPQEKIKKRYMHSKLLGSADWILHNDTDEIISDVGAWDNIRERLSANQHWAHVALVIREVTGYVNNRVGTRHVYRFVRATDDFDPAYADKRLPRGLISDEPIGWHFHMCCSRPEEYYWKWLNRTDDWGSYGSIPPSIENVLPKIREYLPNLGDTTDPVLAFVKKHFPLVDVIQFDDLPIFISGNIHKFPHVVNGKEVRVVYADH